MPLTSPPSPDLPGSRQPDGTYKICLVCLGNICRSPMAEVVLRDELARAGLDLGVSVDSAGTGDWHLGQPMNAAARRLLARHGLGGAAHRARQIQPFWILGYDLVVAMDRTNLENLRLMSPVDYAAGRIRLLRTFDPALTDRDPYGGEVPDPYGGPEDDFELAFGLISDAARGLAQQLAALPGVAKRHSP
jgi:protein-tyrosine phosphatase